MGPAIQSILLYLRGLFSCMNMPRFCISFASVYLVPMRRSLYIKRYAERSCIVSRRRCSRGSHSNGSSDIHIVCAEIQVSR